LLQPNKCLDRRRKQDEKRAQGTLDRTDFVALKGVEKAREKTLDYWRFREKHDTVIGYQKRSGGIEKNNTTDFCGVRWRGGPVEMTWKSRGVFSHRESKRKQQRSGEA